MRRAARRPEVGSRSAGKGRIPAAVMGSRCAGKGVVRAAVMGILGAALTAGGAGCGADRPGRCPALFHEDARREEAVMARLRGTAEGARVLDAWKGGTRVCFGEVKVSVVTEEGVLLMDASADDARQAARAGHLILHLTDGLPALVRGGGECERRVDSALALEARALSLELSLLEELKAPPRPGGAWEIEEVYRAAAPAKREEALIGYLRSHPEGAPGVDGLVAGYTRRCESQGKTVPR
ncbi:MAG: hypothetical protein R3B70_31145 [Polyangiaceae bacterium]